MISSCTSIQDRDLRGKKFPFEVFFTGETVLSYESSKILWVDVNIFETGEGHVVGITRQQISSVKRDNNPNRESITVCMAGGSTYWFFGDQMKKLLVWYFQVPEADRIFLDCGGVSSSG